MRFANQIARAVSGRVLAGRDHLQHTHPHAWSLAHRNGISVQNRRLNVLRDPRINRHSGKLHEHRREIARHLRQMARRANPDVRS